MHFHQNEEDVSGIRLLKIIAIIIFCMLLLQLFSPSIARAIAGLAKLLSGAW